MLHDHNILFLMTFQDEIDALASSRAADGDNSAHEGVITSLLNEMDGVQELQGVTIIAATNRPEIIVCEFLSKRRGIEKPFPQDSALMRPGRFDRALYVGPPDQAGREEILKIHIKNMAVDPDIDIVEIAKLVGSLVFTQILDQRFVYSLKAVLEQKWPLFVKKLQSSPCKET